MTKPPENTTLQNDTETAESVEISSLVLPLYQSLFWIRLFAACLIFYGALITVTGIGVLIAWIPMIVGILLILSTKSISLAYKENNQQAFKRSLLRLKSIFTILGLASVGLISISSIYLVKYAIDKSLF